LSDNSYPTIHPSIQREIDYVKGECQNRHRRTNAAVLKVAATADADHDLLIELTGRSGRNGRVGALETKQKKSEADIEAIEAAQRADHADLAQLKMGQFKWSGFGGIAGGGSIAGLIEFARWLI